MRNGVRMRHSAAMRSAALILLILSGCATVPARPLEIPVSEVGVAFDRAGEVGSFAQGLADPASGRAVTPDDPVRVALVGGGYMARCIALQIATSVRGMRLVAVAIRVYFRSSPAGCRDAVRSKSTGAAIL